jgi:hypothetical protein
MTTICNKEEGVVTTVTLKYVPTHMAQGRHPRGVLIGDTASKK